MPVEDVFPGGVVTGGVVRGQVTVGDPVEVVGPAGPVPAVVTRVEKHALTLDGAPEVERGHVVAAPGTITAHDEFDARVTFNPEADLQRPLDPTRFHFYFRAAVVPGVATRAVPGTTIDLGVRLAHPVPMEVGQRFPIRQGGSNIGHGVVTGLLTA
jgi:elongation factor Tu